MTLRRCWPTKFVLGSQSDIGLPIVSIVLTIYNLEKHDRASTKFFPITVDRGDET